MTTWTMAEQHATDQGGNGTGVDRLLLAAHTGMDGSAVRMAAVVDGASDKSGRTRQTGGALAVDTVASALLQLAPGTPPLDAVGEITAALAMVREAWGIADEDVLAPGAVCAVAAPEQGLLWRVGGVHIAVLRDGTWELCPADKAIDGTVAAARAALLNIGLARGRTLEELSASDPGRTMVVPILRGQNVLGNDVVDTMPGSGVLDGRAVPARYVETFSLAGVSEIVLACDRYLAPAPTLRQAEEDLARSLAENPLRIGTHPATEGISPGALASEDRTYLRLVRVQTDTVVTRAVHVARQQPAEPGTSRVAGWGR